MNANSMMTTYKGRYTVVPFIDLNAMENNRVKKLKLKPADRQNLIKKGEAVYARELKLEEVKEVPVAEQTNAQTDVREEEPATNEKTMTFNNLWQGVNNHEVNTSTVTINSSLTSIPAATIKTPVEPVKKELHEMEAPSIKGLESIEKREERFRRMFKKAQEELSDEDKDTSYVFKVLKVGFERLEKINKIISELKEMSNIAKEKINVYNVRNTSANQVKEELINCANAINIKNINETKFSDINAVVLEANQNLVQITELKKAVEQANTTLATLMQANDKYKEKEKKIAQDCDDKIDECMKEKQNFFDVMDRSLVDAEKIDKLHAQDKKLREERRAKITALTDLIPMLTEEEEPQTIEKINSLEGEDVMEMPNMNGGRVINIFDEYRAHQNESSNRAA